MTHEAMLDLLLGSNGYISGEDAGKTLGVSRAAVWKMVKALRAQGFGIDSSTGKGYRMISRPDLMTEGELRRELPKWAYPVAVENADSTNTRLRELAQNGAEQYTVFAADGQTGARGRQGRGFFAPRGQGLYFSVLLRPMMPPKDLMALTAFTASAVCAAIESTCGFRPGAKWPNDIVIPAEGRCFSPPDNFSGDNARVIKPSSESGMNPDSLSRPLGGKLCGILTEMTIEAETGLVPYVIIGIGVNVRQESFPPELEGIAVSLKMLMKSEPPSRAKLCAAILKNLRDMAENGLHGERDGWLARYREDCVTIGRRVTVRHGSAARSGLALGLDENAALLVRFDDGTEEAVSCGEVTD